MSDDPWGGNKDARQPFYPLDEQGLKAMVAILIA
jgi:hypothetical protein